ncbi:hypothetical protein CC86DRAFT_2030 [Ophiobolus disseminans]|uniref:Uncharacterized protein n=1 Tax=Ophiobolus disseminans TaxID=1469910 RepID=A0A6A7AI66_9PLEO|nr:hypothetical protein CC86DRAFT_2030 [Ophiobolus disseminans]
MSAYCYPCTCKSTISICIGYQLTSEDILPANLRVPSLQNILVHPTRATQRSRPPLTRLGDLELHTAAHRLRNAKLSPQHLHLQAVLSLAPLDQARFERVRGLQRNWLACRGLGGYCGGLAEARAECVVNTWCRGGRGLELGVRWVGFLGNETERLCRVSALC